MSDERCCIAGATPPVPPVRGGSSCGSNNGYSTGWVPGTGVGAEGAVYNNYGGDSCGASTARYALLAPQQHPPPVSSIFVLLYTCSYIISKSYFAIMFTNKVFILLVPMKHDTHS